MSFPFQDLETFFGHIQILFGRGLLHQKNSMTFVKLTQNFEDRSGSAKLNRSDKCIIGVFSLGKGAGAGGHHEQIIRAA
jgi:hypothetical protein